MPIFYILDVESKGAIARIGLNGAPLALDPTGEGQTIARQANEWIMPKDNALTVFLLWPPHKDYQPGLASVKAAIYRNDPASNTPKPAAGGTFASFTWPARGVPEVYPFPLNIPFAIPEPPPCQLWSDAEEIKELTNQDKSSILALIEKLRAAILARNAQEAFNLTQYKYDDLARANGGDIERYRQNARTQLGVLTRLKDPSSKPFPAASAVFSRCCKNKVVSVTDGPAGEPIQLREKDNASSIFALDIFVSRIKGVWTIVR